MAQSCEVEANCEPLARSFYQHLASGVVNKGNEAVVDLPADVYQSFVNYGFEKEIQARCDDKDRFFRELFFPNIASVPPQLRYDLVLYALDEKKGDFDHLIKTYPCIPTTPDGETLKCPGQLITHTKPPPRCLVLKRRFPFGTKATFLDSMRLARLEQLGMLTDDLQWPEVAERAESIDLLNGCSSEAALKRLKALMDHLERKLRCENGIPFPDDVHNRLLQAKFLQYLKNQRSFPLSWKGDEVQTGTGTVLLSPIESFLKSKKYLVCCSEPIVDQFVPTVVQKFLHFDKRQATFEHVSTQLNVAASTNTGSLDSCESQQLHEVCLAAYKLS
ncbi:hypothetical protein OS493_010860 [Desmophyllum pertusum]|uniref:Uncharacterized protein n=1 Tax=Desmophyllum pertusum TaxID=174260 RepID=A0A9W9ZFQ3_9CNID|nr:hypothetical protein OS493_010860 [Desmophyllum pertusum]